ncbi:hypothetical protein Bca4012_096544 [Brassica carinata]
MGSETMRKLVDVPVLHKFMLYRTLTNFYLIGRDKKKTFWRLLKIDRTDPNELNLFEDPTRYTHEQIVELKKWISRGNQEYSGLRAETTCYGIIGFVKFLGPYYMLVIKKRKKVGEICGHTVYGVVDSQMIMIPYHSGETRVAGSAAERRYKKLLNMVDLSKNFYFSYTYHLMYSLQKNICNTERGKIHDETMFVWNEYLTHGIRRILQNTVWTVSLVYGFFQQTKCLVSNEEFILTVIARRSRHYAGTRRGVNDEGSVANEVEIEQIVTKEVPEDQKIPMTSVVQMRGSIPLFWSQEATVLNSQPDIKCKHHMHSQNIGSLKGKHRENILLEEFRKAIWFINGCMKENYLEAIHFDLHEHYKRGLKVKLLAQYANGLVVLDHQLHLLGIRGPPVVDTNNPLAEKLMEAYEKMGHVIAMQYAGSDAHTKMFSALRGDWNMMMKHRDMLTAVHRYYNNAYQDSEKQDAINVFLGKFKPQLGRPALLELRSDQRNTKSSNPNLEIENLSVHSAIRDEDHFRGTESRQMYPGSSSTSDSCWLDDVPGFSHSYSAKFTTAEEIFERRSSMSSDNMFSDMYKSFTSTTGTDHPSDPDQPADGIVLVPGFSIYFIQWVEHGRALERVRR